MTTTRRKIIDSLAVGLMLAGGVVIFTSEAGATPTPGVITPGPGSNGTQPSMNGPNSPTVDFSLTLPGPEDCPGDTATGNFHIDSFALPAAVSPGAVTYSDGFPVAGGTTYDTAYTSLGSSYTLINTAVTTGQIPVPLPFFSVSRYFSSRGGATPFASGSYTIGIACVDGTGTPQSYWDTSLVIDATAMTYSFPTLPGSGTTTTTTTVPHTTTTTVPRTTTTTVPHTTTTTVAGTTTTTVAGTTTTTVEAATTTTVAGVTTTLPGETTTTSTTIAGVIAPPTTFVPPVIVAPLTLPPTITPVASSAGTDPTGTVSTLAATGVDTTPETAAGAAMIGLGAFILLCGRVGSRSGERYESRHAPQ